MTTEPGLHDIVLMKKPHACGANEWEIIRVGADVKIKCRSCGRIVMLDRETFLKKRRKTLSAAAGENESD